MINAVNRKVANAMKHSANSAPSPATQPVNTDNETFFQGNKKLIIGGVAALTVAGATAAYVVTKHRMPAEVKELLDATMKTEIDAKKLAQVAQKEIDEAIETTMSVYAKAQEKFNEVTRIFNELDQAAKKGGTDCIVKQGETIYQYTDSTKTTLLRKFEGDMLYEFADDGERVVRETHIGGWDGKTIDCISEGIEETGVAKKIEQKYLYRDDELPQTYQEGVEIIGDTESAAKYIMLGGGDLNLYCENYKKVGVIESAAKAMLWDKNYELVYAKDIESPVAIDEFMRCNSLVKGSAKDMVFWSDGRLCSYEKDPKFSDNDGYTVKKRMFYGGGGKPVNYLENFDNFSSGKCLDFEDGMPCRCTSGDKTFTKTEKGWEKEDF